MQIVKEEEKKMVKSEEQIRIKIVQLESKLGILSYDKAVEYRHYIKALTWVTSDRDLICAENITDDNNLKGNTK